MESQGHYRGGICRRRLDTPPAVRGAGPALLCRKRGLLSVGDAPKVTSAPCANHLAVAVGGDVPKGPRDLTDLEQGEDQQLFAQTPIAIKPAWVGSQERLDAIGVVHVQIIGANRPRLRSVAQKQKGRVTQQRPALQPACVSSAAFTARSMSVSSLGQVASMYSAHGAKALAAAGLVQLGPLRGYIAFKSPILTNGGKTSAELSHRQRLTR